MPGYEKVTYENLYDGIDLQTWGQRSHLKYEFHVAPGADYRQIQVQYEGIGGLSVDANGVLHVSLGDGWGDVVDDAPQVYQVIDGQQVAVVGQFVLLDDHTYTFQITGSFDPGKELVIDPNLAWSTYLGGSDSDSGLNIATDAAGNVLVTGYTMSSGWASGGFDTTHNGVQDAFVAKLSATGAHLWSTYMGGSSSDWGRGIATDATGNVLVMGDTYSSGWVSGGFDTSFNGIRDAFVVKLSATGAHLWSTYLGGSDSDSSGNGIAIDTAGNILVTGWTWSSGWVSGGFDTSFNGVDDAFVVKLSATGAHLWSTYLGGSDGDEGLGIATDAAGNVLVAGHTFSSGWVSGGFDTSFNGVDDAFVVKLSATGAHLWSTYLGGSDYDRGEDIAADAAGNVLVTGYTMSSGWVSGGFDTSLNGSSDAFVVKFSATGTHLWSTYLGGSSSDSGSGIVTDAASNVLVTGSTSSSGWVSGGFDTSLNGSSDAFVVKLSATGTHLWSTYLGGSNSDYGGGIATDAASNVLVTGYTYSTDFAAANNLFNGGYDAFVAKISGAGDMDVGDTMQSQSAKDFGTLTTNALVTQQEEIGNGSYGARDVDMYKFTLTQSDEVYIRVTPFDGHWVPTASASKTFVRLFDSTGTELSSSLIADNDIWPEAYIQQSLPSGTYYVGVSGKGNDRYNPSATDSRQDGDTGPYTIRLTCGNGLGALHERLEELSDMASARTGLNLRGLASTFAQAIVTLRGNAPEDILRELVKVGSAIAGVVKGNAATDVRAISKAYGISTESAELIYALNKSRSFGNAISAANSIFGPKLDSGKFQDDLQTWVNTHFSFLCTANQYDIANKLEGDLYKDSSEGGFSAFKDTDIGGGFSGYDEYLDSTVSNYGTFVGQSLPSNYPTTTVIGYLDRIISTLRRSFVEEVFVPPIGDNDSVFPSGLRNLGGLANVKTGIELELASMEFGKAVDWIYTMGGVGTLCLSGPFAIPVGCGFTVLDYFRKQAATPRRDLVYSELNAYIRTALMKR